MPGDQAAMAETKPEEPHGRCHALRACLPDNETPLLPTRDGCKTAKVKPVCDACGYKAQVDDQGKPEEHMFGKGDGVIWNRKQQSCCALSIFLFVYFVIFGIIQWIMFHWATENCGALKENYNFPGGGYGCPKALNCTTADVNLLPRNALIVGREPSLYGEAFDVFNSTNEGQMVSAPVGTWFRTWGPWFWTYTYQDTLNSKATVYMRATVLSMFGVMEEHKAMRCDGKGEVLKFTEGTAVVGNAFRAFFQTNTGRVMKMLIDGKEVAVVEETFHGQKSATFRTLGEQKDTIGSVILRGINQQGFNEWFLKNDFDAPLPFWMTSGVATAYAFKIKNEKASKINKPPQFLAALAELLSPHNNKIHVEHTAAQQSKDIPKILADLPAEVPSVKV